MQTLFVPFEVRTHLRPKIKLSQLFTIFLFACTHLISLLIILIIIISHIISLSVQLQSVEMSQCTYTHTATLSPYFRNTFIFGSTSYQAVRLLIIPVWQCRALSLSSLRKGVMRRKWKLHVKAQFTLFSSSLCTLYPLPVTLPLHKDALQHL
jgi:hypothetical protein